MSQLRTGWTVATVEELPGEGGLVTDGDWIESKDQDPAGRVRLIQLADIGDGEFRDRSSRFVTERTVERLRCTYLQAGDLLIARMPDPLGRACVLPEVSRPAITAVDVFIWRAGKSSAADARWLMHSINSPDVRGRIADQAGGTTRQRIAGGRLKQLPLPVPPLPEQRRIVAKIDSLTGKSKRARDHLDHIPRLVEKYRQAVLMIALRGDLTQEWRTEIGGLAPWEMTTPAAHFDWSSGENLPSKQQISGSVPVIGGNGIGGYHNEALIDFPTLVIGRVGAQCGNVHFSSGPAWITDNAIYARSVSDRIDLAFAIIFFRNANLNQLAGGSGQPYVNQTTLNGLSLALPTLEEQREIVRRVEGMLGWVDRLAVNATSARKLIDHLDQAVLAKAFRGELVPQDPGDEPASVLLDCIRARRTATPKPKRGRRKAA